MTDIKIRCQHFSRSAVTYHYSDKKLNNYAHADYKNKQGVTENMIHTVFSLHKCALIVKL